MSNNAPITRVPTLILAVLVSIGVFFTVFAAVQLVGAAPQAFDCSTVSMNQKDCQALVELYESTDGANWTVNSNWLSGSPCSDSAGWYGVTCQDSRVQQVVLTDNNLVGTLPAAVLNLEQLAFIHLGLNQIGGAIPEISNQQSPLFGLYLNENAFDGEIPQSLGTLANLEFLYLNGNRLSGPVPRALCALRPVKGKSGIINLTYNALNNDEVDSDLCLDAADSQWRATQTVPPAPRFRFTAVEGIDRQSNGALIITWEPIDFTDGGGFYEVFKSTTSGEYGKQPAARTASKSENSITVGDIQKGETYYFVVRTKSFANEFNPNEVNSEFSEEITNKPVALTLADFQAASQASPMLLIVAALLVLTTVTAVTFANYRR